MHNILNKLQQLNESAEPVAEAHGKVGEKCSCCGNTIKKDGTCGCDEDCPHCGGKPAKVKKEKELDEMHCNTKKKKTNESVEARLLKEYAEFKESHCNTKRKKMSEEPNEGNAYAHAVRKAKMDGAEKGDKVPGPDGPITLTTEMFDKHEKVGTKKKTTHGTAEKTATGLKHTRDYKPDYLDLDKDGDTEEPMKQAAKDKKEKKA